MALTVTGDESQYIDDSFRVYELLLAQKDQEIDELKKENEAYKNFIERFDKILGKVSLT